MTTVEELEEICSHNQNYIEELLEKNRKIQSELDALKSEKSTTADRCVFFEKEAFDYKVLADELKKKNELAARAGMDLLSTNNELKEKLTSAMKLVETMRNQKNRLERNVIDQEEELKEAREMRISYRKHFPFAVRVLEELCDVANSSGVITGMIRKRLLKIDLEELGKLVKNNRHSSETEEDKDGGGKESDGNQEHSPVHRATRRATRSHVNRKAEPALDEKAFDEALARKLSRSGEGAQEDDATISASTILGRKTISVKEQQSIMIAQRKAQKELEEGKDNGNDEKNNEKAGEDVDMQDALVEETNNNNEMETDSTPVAIPAQQSSSDNEKGKKTETGKKPVKVGRPRKIKTEITPVSAIPWIRDGKRPHLEPQPLGGRAKRMPAVDRLLLEHEVRMRRALCGVSMDGNVDKWAESLDTHAKTTTGQRLTEILVMVLSDIKPIDMFSVIRSNVSGNLTASDSFDRHSVMAPKERNVFRFIDHLGTIKDEWKTIPITFFHRSLSILCASRRPMRDEPDEERIRVSSAVRCLFLALAIDRTLSVTEKLPLAEDVVRFLLVERRSATAIQCVCQLLVHPQTLEFVRWLLDQPTDSEWFVLVALHLNGRTDLLAALCWSLSLSGGRCRWGTTTGDRLIGWWKEALRDIDKEVETVESITPDGRSLKLSPSLEQRMSLAALLVSPRFSVSIDRLEIVRELEKTIFPGITEIIDEEARKVNGEMGMFADTSRVDSSSSSRCRLLSARLALAGRVTVSLFMEGPRQALLIGQTKQTLGKVNALRERILEYTGSNQTGLVLLLNAMTAWKDSVEDLRRSNILK